MFGLDDYEFEYLIDLNISALKIYSVSDHHFWVYFFCGCEAFQYPTYIDAGPKCQAHKEDQ